LQGALQSRRALVHRITAQLYDERRPTQRSAEGRGELVEPVTPPKFVSFSRTIKEISRLN
jgi:hypothetical protein